MNRLILLAAGMMAGNLLAGVGSAAAEEAAASQSLFNGKDLAGWHADVPELDKNPARGIRLWSATGCS